MNYGKKLYKRMKNIINSIYQAIGILDISKENNHKEQNRNHHRRRKATAVVTKGLPNRQSKHHKVKVTPKSSVKDALLIGISLREINRCAPGTHKQEEKERLTYDDYLNANDFFDDGFDFLDDDLDPYNKDEDYLNEDVYDEDYTHCYSYPLADDNNFPEEYID